MLCITCCMSTIFFFSIYFSVILYRTRNVCEGIKLLFWYFQIIRPIITVRRREIELFLIDFRRSVRNFE